MLKLHLDRNLDSGNWDIEWFLQFFNDKIIARKSYEYLSQAKGKVSSTSSNLFYTKSSTGKPKYCVFFKKNNHYSNQCNIITDVQLWRKFFFILYLTSTQKIVNNLTK